MESHIDSSSSIKPSPVKSIQNTMLALGVWGYVGMRWHSRGQGLKMQFCRLCRAAQIKVSIIWIMQDAAIKLLDMILTQTFTELRGRNPSATEPCLRALNRPGVPFVALRATRTRITNASFNCWQRRRHPTPCTKQKDA